MDTIIDIAGFVSLAEKERISILHRQQILDSQYEMFYDSILKLVIKMSGLPLALITIVGEERVWLKSKLGLSEVAKIPPFNTFCEWIVANDDYIEIGDTTKSALNCIHLLVTGNTKFRFYAGAPIKLPLGEVIGTLCLFDTQPNKLTKPQRETLIGLTDVIAKALITKNHCERLGRAVSVIPTLPLPSIASNSMGTIYRR